MMTSNMMNSIIMNPNIETNCSLLKSLYSINGNDNTATTIIMYIRNYASSISTKCFIMFAII